MSNGKFMLRITWFSAIIILAYVLQTHILLEGDVAYLAHVAGQLINGQEYGVDIFETNPPMILYLSLPIYWLVKYHLTSVTIGARLYIFLLAISSWVTVSWMLGRLLAKKDWLLRLFLESLILFVLLYLPVNQLGQREHIFVILTFPYVLSVICLLENKPIRGAIIYVIGLAAGLGFALKPYFLLSFILLECYVAWCKKSLITNIRIETCIIAAVGILYLCSVYIFQPSYISVMLPLISHFYLSSIALPWIHLFINLYTLSCIMVVIITMILTIRGVLKFYFSMVWLLTLLGMTSAYLIARTTWFYHLIPALVYATLLVGYCFFELSRRIFKSFDSMSVTKLVAWLFVLCILSLFFGLTFIRLYVYSSGQFQGIYDDLMNYVKNLPKKSRKIMCLSANTRFECFPLVYISDAKYAASGPIFWWLGGVLKREKYPSITPLSKKRQAEKNFLVNSIIRDLTVKKPCVIIINPLRRDPVEPVFDFFAYFSNYSSFNEAIHPYVQQKNIGHYKIYRRYDEICRSTS